MYVGTLRELNVLSEQGFGMPAANRHGASELRAGSSSRGRRPCLRPGAGAPAVAVGLTTWSASEMGSWCTGLLARAWGAEGTPALLILKKSLALGRGMAWFVAPFSTVPAYTFPLSIPRSTARWTRPCFPHLTEAFAVWACNGSDMP